MKGIYVFLVLIALVFSLHIYDVVQDTKRETLVTQLCDILEDKDHVCISYRGVSISAMMIRDVDPTINIVVHDNQCILYLSDHAAIWRFPAHDHPHIRMFYHVIDRDASSWAKASFNTMLTLVIQAIRAADTTYQNQKEQSSPRGDLLSI